MCLYNLNKWGVEAFRESIATADLMRSIASPQRRQFLARQAPVRANSL
ncbi:hypothetical protein CKA32_004699 [Geitlerinema sp. FC II]|nr:hypothetical protein CKA32_004699 [Geitlerinema sp. FC II]